MENPRTRFETNNEKAALRAEMIDHEIIRFNESVDEFIEDAEWRLEMAGKAKSKFERRRRIEERDASLYQVKVLHEMIAALKAIK